MGLISENKDLSNIITTDKIKTAYVKDNNESTRFYQKSIDFMKKAIEKCATRVRGVILGAAHFYRKVENKYQEGVRIYSMEEELGEWNLTTVTREIELEDIPPKYRVLDDDFEIDDTQELLEALVC